MNAARTAQAYAGLLTTCLEQGIPTAPRGKPTIEILDAEIKFPGDPCLVRGEMDLAYAKAELEWYASKDRDPGPVAGIAKLWDNCRNPDGMVNSNYGHLVFGGNRTEHGHITSEFGWALSRLQEDRDTRQAVMVYHRPEHHWKGNRDVPCTLTESFMLRDHALTTRVHMRSSDLWFGLPFDMVWHQALHQCMLARLREYWPNEEVRDGGIRMRLDSAHLYDRHIPRAKAYLANPPTPLPLPGVPRFV